MPPPCHRHTSFFCNSHSVLLMKMLLERASVMIFAEKKKQIEFWLSFNKRPFMSFCCFIYSQSTFQLIIFKLFFKNYWWGWTNVYFVFTRRLQRDVVYFGWPIAPSDEYSIWAQKGGGDCGVSANENSFAHGAQINFEDLTPVGYKEMSSILADQSALVYEPKWRGRGWGIAGSQPMSTAVHMEPK
jgi:hypothetical protein